MTNPASILITGTNRGIGLELARQYLAAGWRVYACCRQPENAHELNRLAQHSSGRLSLHLLDVTQERQRAALAAELAGQPLDILINNAGVYGHGASVFGRLDEGIWLDTLRINAIAPLKLMEALLGNLLLGRRRIMAAITSKMGSIADNTSGGSYAYRSSKAALNAALASAALDLESKGICVVMFNPGWVKTDMGGPRAELPVETCVHQLRRLIEGLRPQDSGRFIDIDGLDVPW